MLGSGPREAQTPDEWGVGREPTWTSTFITGQKQNEFGVGGEPQLPWPWPPLPAGFCLRAAQPASRPVWLVPSGQG